METNDLGRAWFGTSYTIKGWLLMPLVILHKVTPISEMSTDFAFLNEEPEMSIDVTLAY